MAIGKSYILFRILRGQKQKKKQRKLKHLVSENFIDASASTVLEFSTEKRLFRSNGTPFPADIPVF